MSGVLTETRRSNIVLSDEGYAIDTKTSSVTDHYKDSVHEPVTASDFESFENIEDTNEMRLIQKRNFDGTSSETTRNFEYDERGNLIKETTSYTGAGKPGKELHEADDRTVEYEYDSYGNRIKTTDSSGSPNRITETEFDDELFQFTVKETAIGDTYNLSTEYEINYGKAFGAVIKKTDPNSNSTYFEYDSLGRLVTQSADVNGSKEILNEYSYSNDFPLSVKLTAYTGTSDADIETRVFADGFGRAIHTVRSAGSEEGKSYTKTGRIIYDSVGRVIRKSQTHWADDYEINRFVKTLREKYPTYTFYDASGRVSKVILPRAFDSEPETSTSYVYTDPWVTTVYHSIGRSKTTIKNARGLVLYVRDSGTGDDGKEVSAAVGFKYDVAGRRVNKYDIETSPPGPLSLEERGSKIKSKSVGKAGFSTNTVLWEYDGFGRLKIQDDPDLGVKKYVYNQFGDIILTSDSMGRVTGMIYDRLGRIREKILPGIEGRVSYVYDSMSGSDNSIGRIVCINDPAGSKHFSYDELGRVKKETRTIDPYKTQYVTEFEFDLLSRKKVIVYPEDPLTEKQLTVTYSYCASGVKSVSADTASETKSVIDSITYNEFGQSEIISRGNGTVTQYEYDIRGRLARLITSAGPESDEEILQDVTYNFRTDNSIASKQEETDSRNVSYAYSYDGLNRLVYSRGEASIPGQEASPPGPLSSEERGSKSKMYERGYSYAANGNLTAKTMFDPESHSAEDSWIYSYTNHAVKSINSTKSGGERFRMVYDLAGNMVYQSDDEKNITKMMKYDSYNRIRKVIDPDTGSVKGQYWYDDQGLRVRKVYNEGVLDEGNPLVDVEVLYPSMYFGVEKKKTLSGHHIPGKDCAVNNIYLNGVRIAALTTDGRARFYLTDQVDSVKVVSDEKGRAVSRFEYLPYGEAWFTQKAEDVEEEHSPKFNSQELDRESGFYFYNARHYDSVVGRFVSADTVVDGELSTQGWNRYSYCHGNPIRYKDPTGHRKSDNRNNSNTVIININDEQNQKKVENIKKDLLSRMNDASKGYHLGAYKLNDVKHEFEIGNHFGDVKIYEDKIRIGPDSALDIDIKINDKKESTLKFQTGEKETKNVDFKKIVNNFLDYEQKSGLSNNNDSRIDDIVGKISKKEQYPQISRKNEIQKWFKNNSEDIMISDEKLCEHIYREESKPKIYFGDGMWFKKPED